jgi:cytochrome c-type biogenesis protein CcmH
VLVLLGLGWVLRPLLWPGAARSLQPQSANLAILRNQLAELEADREAGLIPSEQYALAREELERRVLEEAALRDVAPMQSGDNRPLAIFLVVVVSLSSVGMYAWMGGPQALEQSFQADTQLAPHEVDAMITQLAERMAQQPEDEKGWRILARSYYALGRYAESAQAYERLVKLVPRDAEALADYADALAMLQGRDLRGRPAAMLGQALALDPTQWKALMLLGSEAFEREDYRSALGYWERLQPMLPPDSELKEQLNAAIETAHSRLPTSSRTPSRSNTAQSVSGTVSLAPQWLATVAPEDHVFVFARAAEGPKMPLAVLRFKVKDLPARFALGDAQAMRPDARLSQHARIVVGARVSKSGNATPQSGDLEGYSPPVKADAQQLQLLIDTKIP